MGGKALGLVLALVGLAVLALGLAPVYDSYTKSIILLSFLSANNLLIIGAGLVIVGIVLTRSRGSGKQPAEVPIYHGKNVVGYRRLRK